MFVKVFTILKIYSVLRNDILFQFNIYYLNADNSVVKAIRRLESVKRLVYVACKLSAASNNIVE